MKVFRIITATALLVVLSASVSFAGGDKCATAKKSGSCCATEKSAEKSSAKLEKKSQKKTTTKETAKK